MQGTPAASHCAETGTVVSGVACTTIRSMPSLVMRSDATWLARSGFDWLSLVMMVIDRVSPATEIPSTSLVFTRLMM
jgi:hypothetical protein